MLDYFFRKKLTKEEYKRIAQIPLLFQLAIPVLLEKVFEIDFYVRKKKYFFEIFWAHWNHKTIEIEEELMVLYLTENYKVLGISLEDKGKQDYCTLNFSRVIRRSKKIQATKLVIAHNHPNCGALGPSDTDLKVFSNFKKMAAENNIELITSIILMSSRKYCSF